MMADLDLTEFLKEGSVSNLDWLDVNEQDYRALQALPKQNLDIAPDLQALWRHQDEPATYFVPNTGAPQTMGDLSQAHGHLRSVAEDITRTARLAMMQSSDPARVANALSSRFDRSSLAASRSALAGVMAERGLLGRYYIAAVDFPDCNRGSKTASEFVRRHAPDAKFVIAKDACGECQHRHVSGTGQSHCSVFHKQIQLDVPYSEALAEQVEQAQKAKGRAVQASTGTPRERIQRAFLAPMAQTRAAFTGMPQAAPKPIPQGQGLVAVANLTKKKDEAALKVIAAQKARPILAMLRREMLKGRSEAEVVQALRLAFDQRELEATKAQWEPLFREAGLYGAVYTTQDSFDDCREGADFLNRNASKARVIVAGEKCSSCIFNKVGRCMMYGRKLVAKAEDAYTPEMVNQVLDEHRIAGHLPYNAQRVQWGATPVEALRAIHKAASGPQPTRAANLRGIVEQGFYGQARPGQTTELTKRDILRTAARYMNEGLYGQELLTVLRSRFDSRDLVAASRDLKAVLAEQGLQGIKYVDPSIYEDYGKGCKEAARLHRSRTAVQYLKVGDKCSSCVHQTRPGFCSVINKQLVVEPPYIDKLAEQRAVLSSGPATQVSYESLMNNGLSMMQEYQLQHTEGAIDLNPEAPSVEASIEFGSQSVKL